ncbi:MAG: bifunctional phosphopantothenoylcysteine decarboxylase/phosphopantothenate--cysteine ligase CoaBC [Bacteroidetes bacterium]|jgi:phosphopantothenoylcysteine decarboxylase/phosphopantothenate--cysteine ligase|nr:bifunctional phosphopantothenoylcysteine decarboxylase/phosphopantothenate--cysteine ligase CoaBC [Bacteroidota bacterium]
MSLRGKKIVLGVTGSIAAYKSVFLTRLLIKEGADVKVIMTASAQQFVGAVTFSTLSGHPVVSDLNEDGNWNNHVELGLWADLLLIAPATAHTLAGMANGFADSMLLATYLSAKCPVWIAPAMDLDMWKHPATQANIHKLQSFSHRILDVENGFLASGLHGKGRMAEPENILKQLVKLDFEPRKGDLQGQTILITAGPTYEPIDPVRFIGNRSTGKMGVALTKAALARGASVHLLHGPLKTVIPRHPNLTLHDVMTASEMFQAATTLYPKCNGGILTAAVSDFKPASFIEQKIKSKDQFTQLSLEKTQDIAAHLGREKNDAQWLIGFALETQNSESNAAEKRKKKNFDFIILNKTSKEDSPFGANDNKVWIIRPEADPLSLPKANKLDVAHDILDQVVPIITTMKN